MTRSSHQGFTLIETLVAISVLVIAIVVPLRVISQSLKSASFTRESITAAHLAQEGVELMNIAVASSTSDLNTYWDWDTSTYPQSGFSFEPITRELIHCDSTSANPCKMYLGEEGYTHAITASTTPFARALYVRLNDVDPLRVAVESVVTWRNVFGVTSTSSRTVWFYNRYE